MYIRLVGNLAPKKFNYKDWVNALIEYSKNVLSRFSTPIIVFKPLPDSQVRIDWKHEIIISITLDDSYRRPTQSVIEIQSLNLDNHILQKLSKSICIQSIPSFWNFSGVSLKELDFGEEQVWSIGNIQECKIETMKIDMSRIRHFEKIDLSQVSSLTFDFRDLYDVNLKREVLKILYRKDCSHAKIENLDRDRYDSLNCPQLNSFRDTCFNLLKFVLNIDYKNDLFDSSVLIDIFDFAGGSNIEYVKKKPLYRPCGN